MISSFKNFISLKRNFQLLISNTIAAFSKLYIRFHLHLISIWSPLANMQKTRSFVFLCKIENMKRYLSPTWRGTSRPRFDPISRTRSNFDSHPYSLLRLEQPRGYFNLEVKVTSYNSNQSATHAPSTDQLTITTTKFTIWRCSSLDKYYYIANGPFIARWRWKWIGILLNQTIW